MATDRRMFLKGVAASTLGSIMPAAASAQEAEAGSAQVFSFERLIGQAEQLAANSFEPPPNTLPEPIDELNYDQYRDIWFKPDAAIWMNEATDFRLDLFHPGFLYTVPVRIALVEDGEVTELPFSTDLFEYGHLVEPPAGPDGLGFAGFRARYPIRTPGAYQEFVTFLGASYFRAVARDQSYGLSARGLAIDTAEPSGEEFPFFRAFWIEKPGPESDTLVVHALLDSLSVAGAYRFEITPGAETVMDVRAVLFFRREVTKVGIAPLTSMFLFNPMNRAGFDDYRRAVHDSDGLQMLTGSGEWIWRPLSNPAELQISDFSDLRPRGFGLMQRARRYEDFEDAEAKYERRPSLWVEPIGDWGDGAVELVEIPTDSEVNDNIVAYWRSSAAIGEGARRDVSYRLRWTNQMLPPDELLWVSSSRAGRSLDGNRRHFAVDFHGNGDESRFVGLEVQVSASRGKLANAVIHDAHPNGALRVSFELSADGEEFSELRLLLTRNGNRASETWLYRWTAA